MNRAFGLRVELPQLQSIAQNGTFQECQEAYDTASNDLVEVSDIAPTDPAYPMYEAAGNAYEATRAALYAVIDAHTAVQVYKAVQSLLDLPAAPSKRL